MAPDWWQSERRHEPDPNETTRLLWDNVKELAQQGEGHRSAIQENTFQIRKIDDKLDRVLIHIEKHEHDAEELLNTVRFAKRLRQWLLGMAGGAALLFTATHSGAELWQLIKDLLSGRP